MNQEDILKRIVLMPDVMTGKPVIRGTRLTVQYILNLLAQGLSENEILAEYQGLQHDDITACLLYASKTIADTEFMPFITQA